MLLAAGKGLVPTLMDDIATQRQPGASSWAFAFAAEFTSLGSQPAVVIPQVRRAWEQVGTGSRTEGPHWAGRRPAVVIPEVEFKAKREQALTSPHGNRQAACRGSGRGSAVAKSQSVALRCALPVACCPQGTGDVLRVSSRAFAGPLLPSPLPRVLAWGAQAAAKAAAPVLGPTTADFLLPPQVSKRLPFASGRGERVAAARLTWLACRSCLTGRVGQRWVV